MRVLRLSNSDDFGGDLPPEARAWHIAQEELARAIGEPVETEVRATWPNDSLPALVDRWIERYAPDLVFLKVNWYWYGYESVPLRLRRKVPVLGRFLAAAGDGATNISWLSRTRAFKAGRNLAARLIGGDTPFTCEEVIECMQSVIRRVIAHEEVVLVVKGAGGGRPAAGSLAPYFDRFTQRRQHVEGAIEAFCRDLGIHYVGIARQRTREESDIDKGDGVHKGEYGLRRVGEHEGRAMAEAWEADKAGKPGLVIRI